MKGTKATTNPILVDHMALPLLIVLKREILLLNKIADIDVDQAGDELAHRFAETCLASARRAGNKDAWESRAHMITAGVY